MNRKWPGKIVFGELNESHLWAWHICENSTTTTGRLPLSPGQILMVLPIAPPMEIDCGKNTTTIDPGSIAVIRSDELSAPVLHLDHSTEAFIVGVRHSLLVEMLTSFRPELIEDVRELIFSNDGNPLHSRTVHGKILTDILPAFLNPPVSGAARSFWFEGQFKALLSLICFAPSESSTDFFCSRQKRLSFSRVGKAKAHLEANLDDSLDLHGLATLVGCSPFYLSRTFSATTGMTISQYVRMLRIEKAADLIQSGRYNVSEAASEVGYQSLSHFSKAFQQVKGCLPSKYEAA
jgi:AraC-like DNA-binding protein